MRKFFSLFAFAAMILSFAACSGNEPESKGFAIEMRILTEEYATFTITPGDQNADYFWTVYPKCVYEDICKEYAISEEDEYVDNVLLAWANPENDWYYNKSIHARKGTATIDGYDVLLSTGDAYENRYLCPNCEFRIAVCQINADKKRIGNISYQSFKTLMPEGYVDLGMDSESAGALWNCNYVFEDGQAKYYTYNEAWDKLNTCEEYEQIPSLYQWDRLMNLCTLTWTNDLSSVNGDMRYAGVKGYVATSESNGNSIYLPAFGGKNKSGSSTGVGTVGIYWARNEHTTDVDSYVMWLPKSGDFQEQVMSIENSFSLCLVCPRPIDWYLVKIILKPL